MAENDAKHRAKRWNERMKLIATFFSSSAIITVAGVVITPLANRHYDALADGGWILLRVAFGLHLVGQFALGFLRAEE